MDPMTEQLQFILLRDLTAFQMELEGIPENQLWVKAEGFPNAPGNLALHIAGNLQHFIGSVLGDSSYQRNREAEFNAHAGTLAELQQELTAARKAVEDVLPRLSAEDLAQDFPMAIEGRPMATQAFLVRIAVHLSYHLGQLNVLKRILR